MRLNREEQIRCLHEITVGNPAHLSRESLLGLPVPQVLDYRVGHRYLERLAWEGHTYTPSEQPTSKNRPHVLPASRNCSRIIRVASPTTVAQSKLDRNRK
jgi:hypothetical protein